MRYRLAFGLLLVLPFIALGTAAPASAGGDPFRDSGCSFSGAYPHFGGLPFGGLSGSRYLSCPGDRGSAYFGQGYGLGGYRLPGGEWRYSCRNIVVRGSHLSAECLDPGGGWEQTRITYTLCRNGMMNRGGSLECKRAAYYYGAPAGNGVPGGSFRASCRNEQVQNGFILTARCIDSNGNYRRTAIDLRACGRGDIRNRGGQLFCRAQSGAW